MGIVMGVMAAIMIIGFLGFGNHHGMMEGREKEEQKQEKVLHESGKDSDAHSKIHNGISQCDRQNDHR
ncbi:MAG: hypothetical protein HY266_00895 [Deltaproteobacteria bacterium]|nr:hypothetical protein [Deltaproteobacteria bacterium]